MLPYATVTTYSALAAQNDISFWTFFTPGIFFYREIKNNYIYAVLPFDAVRDFPYTYIILKLYAVCLTLLPYWWNNKEAYVMYVKEK